MCPGDGELSDAAVAEQIAFLNTAFVPSQVRPWPLSGCVHLPLCDGLTAWVSNASLWAIEKNPRLLSAHYECIYRYQIMPHLSLI